jgi:Ca-activated chloride channel family protein
LTLDYAAAQLFTDQLEADLIPVKGTAIGRALRVASETFEGSPIESRAILLITDGEDHSGEALSAADALAEAGIRVFVIGIGRDEGSPIPAPDGGFRRDRRGEIILSKLDEATLQEIALRTGGRYVRSVTGDMDLDEVYLEGIKRSLVDVELGSTRQQLFEDRFQWFLLFALMALMVEPLLPVRGRAT